MTRLDIVNASLIIAGQTPVLTVADSKAARLCDKQLKLSLDPVLSAHPWDELKVQNSLIATNGGAGLYPGRILGTKAGNPSFNEYLFFVDLDDLEYPFYSLDGEDTGLRVRFDGAGWEAISDADDIVYTNPSTDKEPPKLNWVQGTGSNPVPELEYPDPVIPPYEYGYSFVRPFDFARLVEEEPRGYRYDNVKGYIYGDYSPFEFSYVCLPTSTTLTSDWQDLPYTDAAFDNLAISGKLQDVLCHHIISRCIYGITGDHNDTQLFTQLYMSSLGKVTNVQAQQQRDKFLTVNEDSPNSFDGARI
jgi:hypothetical protein